MKFQGLILDWDGVFHDGRKSSDGASSFSEIDSMGLNMLRYGYYRQYGKPLPVAIVTGERSPTAEAFAQREHLDGFMYYARDKRRAVPHLEQLWGSSPRDWGFVFDDILDLGLANDVGYRAMVQRPSTEQTQAYAKAQGLVDMWLPETLAVRHFAETVLADLGIFDDCITSRIAYDANYQAYWEMRQSTPTLVHNLNP